MGLALVSRRRCERKRERGGIEPDQRKWSCRSSLVKVIVGTTAKKEEGQNQGCSEKTAKKEDVKA